MMADKEYINREALLEWAREFYPNDKQFISAVMNAPKADVAKINYGKWISTGNALGYTEYHCSECNNYLFLDSKDDELYNYCPYCGAKMDKERECCEI